MSRTGPQPGLFRDRHPAVDAFEARATSPVRRCPACGLDAHRVAVGVGRDLYECGCGAWHWRWACCEVRESVEPTEYRADAVCPRCGTDRFGEQVRPRELTGGVDCGAIAEAARAAREAEEKARFEAAVEAAWDESEAA